MPSYYEIIYILNGTVQHNLNGVVSTLNPGDMCIIMPGQTHFFFRHGPEIEHRDICIQKNLFELCTNFIDTNLLERLKRISTDTIFHIPLDKMTILEQDAISFSKHFLFQNESEDKLLCFNILKYFTDKTYDTSSQGNYPLWLNKLLPRFHTPIYMQNGLPSIMSFVHYHPAYISRAFKKYTGLTMTQYFLLSKLQYASSLLLLSDKTITNIASESGFYSIAYFNKMFKKQYNMTPSQFRHNHRSV